MTHQPYQVFGDRCHPQSNGSCWPLWIYLHVYLSLYLSIYQWAWNWSVFPGKTWLVIWTTNSFVNGRNTSNFLDSCGGFHPKNGVRGKGFSCLISQIDTRTPCPRRRLSIVARSFMIVLGFSGKSSLHPLSTIWFVLKCCCWFHRREQTIKSLAKLWHLLLRKEKWKHELSLYVSFSLLSRQVSSTEGAAQSARQHTTPRALSVKWYGPCPCCPIHSAVSVGEARPRPTVFDAQKISSWASRCSFQGPSEVHVVRWSDLSDAVYHLRNDSGQPWNFGSAPFIVRLAHGPLWRSRVDYTSLYRTTQGGWRSIGPPQCCAVIAISLRRSTTSTRATRMWKAQQLSSKSTWPLGLTKSSGFHCYSIVSGGDNRLSNLDLLEKPNPILFFLIWYTVYARPSYGHPFPNTSGCCLVSCMGVSKLGPENWKIQICVAMGRLNFAMWVRVKCIAIQGTA
jgi:hypothetical protein